jgi:hypothetical protein
MSSFRHGPLSAMLAAPIAATTAPKTNRPRRVLNERTGVH